MKIQLKRSSVLDGGAAKQPLADQLEYGELAVNYASADPAIFIKTSTNDVVQIAGANALTQVPTLDQVTEQGNWSSNAMLVGNSLSAPNLQLNNTGNVVTVGYFRANKGTNTASTFETTLNGTLTSKLLANGTLALGGTIDSTTTQSQATIVVNGATGNIRSTSINTSGAIISNGEITGNAGASLSGTVNVNNSLNVTEGTSLTGAVTMASTLNISGVLTASNYNLGALTALPE